MLKRIKDLELKNMELETQKNQLLQRNILLENSLKTYQTSVNQNITNVPQQPPKTVPQQKIT